MVEWSEPSSEGERREPTMCAREREEMGPRGGPLGVVLAAEAGARGPRGPLGVDFLARLRGRLPDAAFERVCIPPPEGRPCVTSVS